jgi:hypothetical protein
MSPRKVWFAKMSEMLCLSICATIVATNSVGTIKVHRTLDPLLAAAALLVPSAVCCSELATGFTY